MIYRKRVHKSTYELKVTPNFLKIAFGKRVVYLELWNFWHNLISIKDNGLVTTVCHYRRKGRMTVDRERMADLEYIARYAMNGAFN